MGLGNPDLERRIKAGETTLTQDEVLEILDDVGNVRKKLPDGMLNVPKYRRWLARPFVLKFRLENWRLPKAHEFTAGKLSGLMRKYNNDVYALLVDIGLTDKSDPNYDSVLDETPWLIKYMPNKYYFDDIKNRNKAIVWLAETIKKLGRPIEGITYCDFEINNLAGCLRKSGGVIHSALVQADYDVRAADMTQVPKRYWQDENNRANHVRELHSKGTRLVASNLPSELKKQAGGAVAARAEAGLLTLEVK